MAPVGPAVRLNVPTPSGATTVTVPEYPLIRLSEFSPDTPEPGDAPPSPSIGGAEHVCIPMVG